jgi:hypothetical protein
MLICFCFCVDDCYVIAYLGDFVPSLLPFNTSIVTYQQYEQQVKLKLKQKQKQKQKQFKKSIIYFNKGHYASIHQYVPNRHAYHVAQKLSNYQAIMKYVYSTQFLQTNFSIQPLAGMIFHFTRAPLPSHEQMFLNLTVKSLLEQSSHPGLQNYLNGIHDKHLNHHESSNFIFRAELGIGARDQQYQCYEQVSFSRTTGSFSSNPGDADSYRRNAYDIFDLSSSLKSNCPPRRAVLLQRHNRKILNANMLIQLIKKDFDIDVQLIEAPGKNITDEVWKQKYQYLLLLLLLLLLLFILYILIHIRVCVCVHLCVCLHIANWFIFVYGFDHFFSWFSNY